MWSKFTKKTRISALHTKKFNDQKSIRVHQKELNKSWTSMLAAIAQYIKSDSYFQFSHDIRHTLSLFVLISAICKIRSNRKLAHAQF